MGRRFSGADTRYVESIPGPGQYSLPSGVGKQWVSNKPTTPAAAFGKDGIRLRPKVGFTSLDRGGAVVGVCAAQHACSISLGAWSTQPGVHRVGPNLHGESRH